MGNRYFTSDRGSRDNHEQKRETCGYRQETSRCTSLLCKYLIDRGNETRVRVELEKMFRMYLTAGKDSENSKGRASNKMGQVVNMLNTWRSTRFFRNLFEGHSMRLIRTWQI